MAVSTTPLGSFVPNANPTVLSTAAPALPLSGVCYITYAGVCAATLATPTEDGLDLTVFALTADAHTITTAADIINGADDTATFAGAVGDYIHLRSFGGQWVMQDQRGITLGEV